MSESDENVKAAIDSFHAHLDACQQCREHPFDLCAHGAMLLNYFGDIVASEALRPTP